MFDHLVKAYICTKLDENNYGVLRLFSGEIELFLTFLSSLAWRSCQLSFVLPKRVPLELCLPLQLAMWGCAYPVACDLITQQARIGCRMHFLPTRQRRIIRCAAPQKSGTRLAAAARPGEADRAGCGAGAGVSARAAHRAPGPQIAQRCCSAVLCSALLCLPRNRRTWPQLAHRHGAQCFFAAVGTLQRCAARKGHPVQAPGHARRG